MSIDWPEIAKNLLFLVGGGVLGSIATAWNGWWIERHRQRIQARRDFVSSWRRDLVPLLHSEPSTNAGGERAKYAFMAHPSYATLRPHLTDELRKKLEGRTIHAVVGGPPFPRIAIMNEIERIEREWKLV